MQAICVRLLVRPIFNKIDYSLIAFVPQVAAEISEHPESEVEFTKKFAQFPMRCNTSAGIDLSEKIGKF